MLQTFAKLSMEGTEHSNEGLRTPAEGGKAIQSTEEDLRAGLVFKMYI